MIVEEFLKTVVDDYLLHDLESMANFTVQPVTVGALGYPMMISTLAGMELLGSLLMPSKKPNNSEQCFLEYWDNYLVEEQPVYTELGRLFLNLLRHGIAHMFIAKPGIFIEKGTGHQVTIYDYGSRQELHLDCIVFFEDFRKSYFHKVKPIVDGTAKSSRTNVSITQSRLEKIIEDISKHTSQEFGKLKNLHPSLMWLRVPDLPLMDTPKSAGVNLAPSGVIFRKPT
jgi:hypothetical protein